MKLNTLKTVTGALVIVSLCAFVISYVALYETAKDAGIYSGWGIFTTALLVPICIDAFLVAAEGSLFYASLYATKLIPPVKKLVFVIAGVTIWLNLVHGLPKHIPPVEAGYATVRSWTELVTLTAVWIIAPCVQVAGVFVLSTLWKDYLRAVEDLATPVKFCEYNLPNKGRDAESTKRRYEAFMLLKDGKKLPSTDQWRDKHQLNSVHTATRDFDTARSWLLEFNQTGTVAKLEQKNVIIAAG